MRATAHSLYRERCGEQEGHAHRPQKLKGGVKKKTDLSQQEAKATL